MLFHPASGRVCQKLWEMGSSQELLDLRMMVSISSRWCCLTFGVEDLHIKSWFACRWGLWDYVLEGVQQHPDWATHAHVPSTMSNLQFPVCVEDALKAGKQLEGTLRGCHSREICHSDVKPANIYLTYEGRILFTWFSKFVWGMIQSFMWSLHPFPQVWRQDLHLQSCILPRGLQELAVTGCMLFARLFNTSHDFLCHVSDAFWRNAFKAVEIFLRPDTFWRVQCSFCR